VNQSRIKELISVGDHRGKAATIAALDDEQVPEDANAMLKNINSDLIIGRAFAVGLFGEMARRGLGKEDIIKVISETWKRTRIMTFRDRGKKILGQNAASLSGLID
jgi:hypothetical protein